MYIYIHRYMRKEQVLEEEQDLRIHNSKNIPEVRSVMERRLIKYGPETLSSQWDFSKNTCELIWRTRIKQQPELHCEK